LGQVRLFGCVWELLGSLSPINTPITWTKLSSLVSFCFLALIFAVLCWCHNNINLQPSNAGQVDFLPALELFSVLHASPRTVSQSLMENPVS
jgi:hypothetical protein